MHNKKKVIFRADGNTNIGLGHVIRSLALAEMLKQDFDCLFAIQNPSDAVLENIRSICGEALVLPTCRATEENFIHELDHYLSGDEIVVLDGYAFTTPYQEHIKQKCHNLVCIDDIHAYHFVAGLLINHGLLDPSKYSAEPYTKLLLGPKYSLLRSQFLQTQTEKRQLPAENSVFLCFGGSDIKNLTSYYLNLLLNAESVKEIHVVVGSAYPYLQELERVISSSNERNSKTHLYQNLPPDEMVQVLRKCRLALVSGSTIAIESASLGIGVLCGYYVDNQRDIISMLQTSGMGRSIDNLLEIDHQHFYSVLENALLQAEEMAKIQSEYFDFKIRERFVSEFKLLVRSHAIEIRKAAPEDVDVIYNWSNDELTRLNAVNQKPILYEEHCSWFKKKLQAESSFFYIGTHQDVNVGQVRFDYDQDQDQKGFVITFSLAKEARGMKLGAPLLDAAIQQLRRDLKKDFYLLAQVRVNNVASSKIFQQLEFDMDVARGEEDGQFYFFNKKVTVS